MPRPVPVNLPGCRYKSCNKVSFLIAGHRAASLCWSHGDWRQNVAYRLAQQLGELPGQTVGYRMRAESKIGPDTRLEVVTEGILTRMLQQDAELQGVSLVILDEFHERSLQADLALALLLDVQQGLRDDLKLLIMSATLDNQRLSALLPCAPAIVSAGRSFPVERSYQPLSSHERLEEGLPAALSAC